MSDYPLCYCSIKCNTNDRVEKHIKTVRRHLGDDKRLLASYLQLEHGDCATIETIQGCIEKTENSIKSFTQSDRRGPESAQIERDPGLPSPGDDTGPQSQRPSGATDSPPSSNVGPLPRDDEAPLSFLQNINGESLDFDEPEIDNQRLRSVITIEGFKDDYSSADSISDGEGEDSGDEGDDADANVANLADSHTDDLLFESAFFDPPPSVHELRESLLDGYEPPPQPPSSPFEIEPLTEDEKLSLQHYIAWRRTNGTVRAYREHAEVLQDASGIEILSLFNVRKLAVRLARLSPKKVDMCPKSCIAYTGPYADKLACPYVHGKEGVCGTPRYHPTGRRVPYAQFTVLPIIPSICALFANTETSRELRHRDSCLKEVVNLVGEAMRADKERKQFSDFGNGAVHRLHPRMGLFSDSRDIAFACSSDGAQLTMKKHSHTWILILIILNLPASSRYKSSNIIINFSTPGPNAPGDVESFLWPLLQEFAKLGAGVWIWDAIDSAYFLHRSWIVAVLGNMLGSAKLSRSGGHIAFLGDRFSLVQAARASIEKKAKALYYPVAPPDNEKYNPTRPPKYDLKDLPRRSQTHYWKIIKLLNLAKTKTTRATISRDSGIVALPACAASAAFLHPSYFPLDPFHLFYENITPFLWDLWTVHSTPGESIHIPSSKITRFGVLVAEAMKTLPPAFCGVVRNPHLKRQSQYKAYEWMALFHWYILPIGLELEFPPALLQNFSYLVEAVEIAMTVQAHSTICKPRKWLLG